MKNMKKKVVAVLGAATILGTSVFTGAMAADTEIKGKIANMTIFNNGSAMSLPVDQKPIIVNNRTYLPVRALGEALGRNIDWNASNPNSVYITGGQDQATFNQMALELSQAKIQIIDKDKKISDLEAKVKELEEKLKKQNESSSTSFSEFEKKLNRDHGTYKNVYLDIRLTGTENNAKLVVYVDSRDRSIWEGLTSSQREKLIEDIVYDIQREYKKASIDGYVEGGKNSAYFDFYTDTRDKLQFKGSGSSGSGGYLTDSGMETYLENNYRDVYKAEVSTQGYYVDVIVDLNYDLTNSQIEDLVDDMKSDIVNEMKDIYKKDITIKVYYKDGTYAGSY